MYLNTIEVYKRLYISIFIHICNSYWFFLHFRQNRNHCIYHTQKFFIKKKKKNEDLIHIQRIALNFIYRMCTSKFA